MLIGEAEKTSATRSEGPPFAPFLRCLVVGCSSRRGPSGILALDHLKHPLVTACFFSDLLSKLQCVLLDLFLGLTSSTVPYHATIVSSCIVLGLSAGLRGHRCIVFCLVSIRVFTFSTWLHARKRADGSITTHMSSPAVFTNLAGNSTILDSQSTLSIE